MGEFWAPGAEIWLFKKKIWTVPLILQFYIYIISQIPHNWYIICSAYCARSGESTRSSVEILSGAWGRLAGCTIVVPQAQCTCTVAQPFHSRLMVTLPLLCNSAPPAPIPNHWNCHHHLIKIFGGRNGLFTMIFGENAGKRGKRGPIQKYSLQIFGKCEILKKFWEWEHFSYILLLPTIYSSPQLFGLRDKGMSSKDSPLTMRLPQRPPRPASIPAYLKSSYDLRPLPSNL